MDFGELKRLTVFQLGFDADDMGDFEPQLSQYINEGYQGLLMAKDETLMQAFQAMKHDREEPEGLAEIEQRAIADWATWRICSRGNPARQKRGLVFRESFEQVKRRLHGGCGDKFYHY